MACRAVRPRATRDEPSIQVAGATACREGRGQSGSRGRVQGERRTLIADPVRADVPARPCALRLGHRVEVCKREERQNELAQERERASAPALDQRVETLAFHPASCLTEMAASTFLRTFIASGARDSGRKRGEEAEEQLWYRRRATTAASAGEKRALAAASTQLAGQGLQRRVRKQQSNRLAQVRRRGNLRRPLPPGSHNLETAGCAPSSSLLVQQSRSLARLREEPAAWSSPRRRRQDDVDADERRGRELAEAGVGRSAR